MNFEGVLTKMESEFSEPIQYYLVFETDFLNINQLLEKTITLQFIKYQCLNCGLDKPIYRQGFCKSCFFDIPQAADWVLRPELSTAHLDKEDRDLEYEKKVQLQPHIVYLANSSNVKVGVTRKSQIPTRWIDQGAVEAVLLAETPYRQAAGLIEVSLKKHIADKTNWRNMLKNEFTNSMGILEMKKNLVSLIPDDLKQFISDKNEVTKINFPVIQYPQKLTSLNLDKVPVIEKKLMGIKGQYLIFDDNTVINLRSHTAYKVTLEA